MKFIYTTAFIQVRESIAQITSWFNISLIIDKMEVINISFLDKPEFRHFDNEENSFVQLILISLCRVSFALLSNLAEHLPRTEHIISGFWN